MQDSRPASRQVADDLMARIDSGEYPPGSALPPYRQLAADYDIAVNTALAAVRLLRDRGAVSIRRNAGARVRDRSEDLDISEEMSAARTEVADLRAQAQRLTTQLSELEARLAQISERFDVDES